MKVVMPCIPKRTRRPSRGRLGKGVVYEAVCPRSFSGKPGPLCAADLLRAMVNSVAEGAIAVSTSGDLLFYNDAARRMLGMGFVHHSSRQTSRRVGLYRPDGRTPWADKDLPLLRAAQGEKLDRVEMIVRNRRHPKGIVLSVNARPIRDAKRRLLGGIATLRDITPRKEVERELLESRLRLRGLLARIESAREEEQLRIAREIHDELGQTLTALKFDASLLARKLKDGKPPRALVSHVRSMLQLIDSGIHSVQTISAELRPAALEDVGLLDAICLQVKEFQNRTGIASVVSRRTNDIQLPDEFSGGVFRIVQEALTNVARHSGASRVRVTMTGGNGSFRVLIHDNGRGVTARQVAAPTSLGLLGMRERALAMDGELRINGKVGGGTSVVLTIPATG